MAKFFIDRPIFAIVISIFIVLGGGIMEQQEYLAPRIQRAFAEVVIPAIAAHTDIAFARLGNDAGMTGALYNHLQRSVREK